MSQVYLIAKADFIPYVDVASNLPDTKLKPRILEAQNFDLKPLFGDAFYFDFLTKSQLTPTPDPTATALISGGTYVKEGITYNYDGIKPVLVYFAAARLIRALDLHITPNAIMTKRNDFSDHVDYKAIANKVTEYQNQALAYWEDVAKYIVNQGKTVYPLYKHFATCGEDTANFRPKIYGISGKDTQEQYYNPSLRYGRR